MIADKVRAEHRALATRGFSRYAAPEAIRAYLIDARAAQRALDRHVEWLTALFDRRSAEKAAGEWPPPKGAP